MKNFFSHKISFLLLIILISGCSTKKNTWLSRTSQAVNTRFNVYFNGEISYNEGLKSIQMANKEDYSSIIPMYPISRHANASAAISNMDRTIEKCRKAIKLHSIKDKPTKNLKKGNSPEYLSYYNQNEFNPALIEAWILLAKAEFHKGDFLGSSATFAYISRHYSNDKSIVTKCQLWIARAYAEMGWIYEAEQVLSKINQDNINRKDIGLYASVNADLLLKKQQYNEAIPFLELALSKEKDRFLEQRFGYLLAQLNQKKGNNKLAFNEYTKVIKSNPPFEMDFNARINRALINIGNASSIRKDLRKMLRNANNKDYQDQLYYAIGNSYIQNGDSAKAIENYLLSVEKSTRNGVDKAVTLITLGDIYYKKRNYILAQPRYEEASKIITNEHPEYGRISKYAEILNELAAQNDIVQLQDSLQKLAAMPEKKRLEVVNKLIAKLTADEKAAIEKNARENDEQKTTNNSLNFDEDFASLPPIGMTLQGSSRDWYFYNPEIVRSGQMEFQKKWGKRKLEDNWRRTNKTATLFEEESASSIAKTEVTDTVSKSEVVSDVKKPEFYLNQIPVTASQIAKSNTEIANALFNIGKIYKDKVEDLPMAIDTFREFIRRFGTDEKVSDGYFNIYMAQSKLKNQSEAELYRTKLITEFPDSKYHKILSEPDYAERLAMMYREQDSIYNQTYKAYIENKFESVHQHVAYIRQHYPLSTLMPKFLFLNALSIGKSNSAIEFEKALTELVTTYPESDVSPISKDILALIKQGQDAKLGTSGGSLLARRTEIAEAESIEMNAKFEFSTEKNSKHRLMLISKIDEKSMNKLLYKIASFNFSRFLIKDFDLAISKLDSAQRVLSVCNFGTYDEVEWYVKTLNSDTSLCQLLNENRVQKVIISENNYALLKTTFSLKDYLAFREMPVKAKVVTNSALKPEIATTKPTIATRNNNPKKQTTEKAIVTEKTTDNTIEKLTPNLTVPNSAGKEKPVEAVVEKQTVKTITVSEVIKQTEEPLFKNLFAYRANDPHFVAIYIVSGTIDFEKTKAAFDVYNKKNFEAINLKLSIETINKQQVIIIGSFVDAISAKSYLMGMVKEKALFEGLRNASYRNLLGTQKNLNTLMQQNALNVYFEFMQAYYLK